MTNEPMRTTGHAKPKCALLDAVADDDQSANSPAGSESATAIAAGASEDRKATIAAKTGTQSKRPIAANALLYATAEKANSRRARLANAPRARTRIDVGFGFIVTTPNV